MNDSNRIVEFERLNLLGKAVFLGGSAVRLATNAIDSAVRRAADVYVDAEKAFRQGLDDNIEDAKVVREDEASRISNSRSQRSDSASQNAPLNSEL